MILESDESILLCAPPQMKDVEESLIIFACPPPINDITAHQVMTFALPHTIEEYGAPCILFSAHP